ncbi:hypothetical protein JCM5353_000895 [Sporobolomyces roseus]
MLCPNTFPMLELAFLPSSFIQAHSVPSTLKRSLHVVFATCTTHSRFNTNRKDPNINDASSYLDPFPLYGNVLEAQKKVRTFKDGKIFDDVFASQRLFLMPPSTCALMMAFSR